MLNGCRVDVRQSELAPIAIDDEASKKSVSMVYYESHNYGADVGGPSNSLGRSLPDQGITSPTARRNNSRSGGYT